MSYQHDLIVEAYGEINVSGSVKTSSKDRLDKVFIDKFICSRLSKTGIPHIAVFLNDVQRRGEEPSNMLNNKALCAHIKPSDRIVFEDLWEFV